MRSDRSCEETRALAAELALGIADGEERAGALEHVAACADCQRELERLSALADELLELAPEHEPSVGFELRVLDSLEPRRSQRSFRRPALALAGTALLAAALTAGSLFFSARDDVRLAHHYRATLTEAHGSEFDAARFVDAAGAEGGVLFVYRGAPSWLMVTVDPRYRSSATRVELLGANGRTIPLAWPRLTTGSWGGALPVGLDAVSSVRLVDRDGRILMTASVPRNRR